MVRVKKGILVAAQTTPSLCRALVLFVLAVALMLVPFPQARMLATQVNAATVHSAAHHAHAESSAHHLATLVENSSQKAPDNDPHAHPHCLLCVVAASPLPLKAAPKLTPTEVSAESLGHDLALLIKPPVNPNIGARAPPSTIFLS